MTTMFIYHESNAISFLARFPDAILLWGWDVFLPLLTQSYTFPSIRSESHINRDHAAGYLIAFLSLNVTLVFSNTVRINGINYISMGFSILHSMISTVLSSGWACFVLKFFKVFYMILRKNLCFREYHAFV